jgi:DNA polymerase-1
MQNIAQEQGYIDCPIFKGARRHLPDLLKIGSNLSKDKLSHYSNLKNVAVNTGAQAGEAIIVYKSLVKIHYKIKSLNLKSRLIATVHDSIVLYIFKPEAEIMFNILKETMEVFDYSVPIIVESDFGDIWGFSSTADTIEDVRKLLEKDKLPLH